MRVASYLICLLLLAVSLGCNRAPQASSANLDLITSLRTALSAENEEWLDHNDQAVEERRAAGQMTDPEYTAFRNIIDRARAGDWNGAEKAAFQFQKAQRPRKEFSEHYPHARRQAN